MLYKKEELPYNNDLMKRIKNACIFGNVKYEIKQGVIFRIDNTNLSIIEPHKVIIEIKNIKLVLLIYDNIEIFLYNRENLINIARLKGLLKILNKKECYSELSITKMRYNESYQ